MSDGFAGDSSHRAVFALVKLQLSLAGVGFASDSGVHISSNRGGI
jgi:hypothetical protein